jgi:hypothetical protein
VEPHRLDVAPGSVAPRSIAPGSAAPSEYVDFLERTSARVLEDLFPGLRVVHEYFHESTQRDHLRQDEHGPDTLAVLIGPVAHERGLIRKITLLMNEQSRRLVGIPSPRRTPVVQLASPHAELSLKYRTHMPEELRYSLWIATRVSHNWSSHVSVGSSHEIKVAFASQLALWIIAHIAASKLRDISENKAAADCRDVDATSLTIAKIIQYHEILATTRVEHQQLSHAVVVASSARSTARAPVGRYPEDFQALKRTPLLADGESAVFWVSPSGAPAGWVSAESLPRTKGLASAANPFGLLAAASRHLSGIGIGLTRDGLILVYENGRPLLIRRSGRWRGLLWSYIRKRLVKEYGALGAVVYEAAIILSNTRRGGILGIVDRLPGGLHEKDLVLHGWQASGRAGEAARGEAARGEAAGVGPGRRYPEWLFHALLPSDDAVSLGATTLATLSAIDGATLLGRDGKLLAYGAVIPSQPSDSEGARSAAARELSNEGPVIKVSADGPVTLYEAGRLVVEL